MPGSGSGNFLSQYAGDGSSRLGGALKSINIGRMDRFCVKGLFGREKTRLTSSKTTAKRTDGRDENKPCPRENAETEEGRTKIYKNKLEVLKVTSQALKINADDHSKSEVDRTLRLSRVCRRLGLHNVR